jgi:MEMO1 family protein
MLRVRPAAVAGSFYPREAGELSAQVDRLLAEAEPATRPVSLRALIVPHAGYVYSGPTAARAYTLLRPLAARVRRVVLLGPSHFVPLTGLALPDAEAFETPLGRVGLDAHAMKRLGALPQVAVNAAAHVREHAIEVQLAFLQRILSDFTLVPLTVGNARPREIAGVIDTLASPETFILVSSDLSHYLGYEQARAVDETTSRHILALESVSWDNACGAAPVNGLLAWARARRLRAELVDLRNSGDTAGDKERVVGYGSFAFTEVSA